MTLESQHKEYLKKTGTNITFDEWMENVMKPFIDDIMKQLDS